MTEAEQASSAPEGGGTAAQPAGAPALAAPATAPAVQAAQAVPATPVVPAAPAVAPVAGPCLVVVQGGPGPSLQAASAAIGEALGVHLPGREAVVLAAVEAGGEVQVVSPEELSQVHTRPGLPSAVAQGAIPGRASVVGALLREGVRRGAAVLALVSAEPRADGDQWLPALLGPVLEGGYDYACPAYHRHRTEAAINTGVIYPLTRTLYGQDLRQPLGGEAAIALPLARRLLDDPDWRRDPAQAGSDAWLIAKVLTGRARICQSWLGPWPRPEGPPEDLSRTLARALGLVFREMERHAQHWQRAGAPRPVAAFGTAGFAAGEAPRLPVARFVGAFQLGLRELSPLWGQVLAPSTLLGLERAAALPPEDFRLDDAIWVRAVYDFAVAHMARTLERRQLLLSFTPLYLGWLASWARQIEPLDDAGVEARLAALCAAFDRDKRYLIGRWRWPDNFSP